MKEFKVTLKTGSETYVGIANSKRKAKLIASAACVEEKAGHCSYNTNALVRTRQKCPPETVPGKNALPIPEPVPGKSALQIPEPVPGKNSLPIPEPVPGKNALPIPEPEFRSICNLCDKLLIWGRRSRNLVVVIRNERVHFPVIKIFI